MEALLGRILPGGPRLLKTTSHMSLSLESHGLCVTWSLRLRPTLCWPLSLSYLSDSTQRADLHGKVHLQNTSQKHNLSLSHFRFF